MSQGLLMTSGGSQCQGAMRQADALRSAAAMCKATIKRQVNLDGSELDLDRLMHPTERVARDGKESPSSGMIHDIRHHLSRRRLFGT